MDVTLDLVFAVAFLALGVAFRKGLCVEWVLGKDEDVRGKYNEEISMRFFSNLMFILFACNVLSLIGTQLGSLMVSMIGVGLDIAVIIIGMVYFMKNPKFKK